jgi:hypothetical protein
MNDRQILATMIATGALMIGMLVWFFTQPKDCWQRYQTEHEAITNCERPQQSLKHATQGKELQ